MSKQHYIVNCYTCQHNGQETCKGCRTLLVGDDEPYENWQLREDLETKDQKIADLEAKLAESESELENQKEKYDKLYDCYKKTSNEDLQDKYRLAEEVEKLKKELIKKDKIIKDKETIYKSLLKTSHDSIMENEQLKQQLAEKEKTIDEINKEFVQAVKDWKSLVEQKEKEIEKITKIVAYRDDMDRSTTINGVKFTNEQIITLQNIDYFADKHNQDKISFAVEKLKETKIYVDNQHFMNARYKCEKKVYADIWNFIDNQIEELKKEMK